jgi:hypothetical protein
MWDPQVKEEQEETRIFLVEIQFAKGIFMIEGRLGKVMEKKWQVPSVSRIFECFFEMLGWGGGAGPIHKALK